MVHETLGLEKIEFIDIKNKDRHGNYKYNYK